MSNRILFCDNSLRELLNFREDVIRYYIQCNYQVALVAPPNAIIPDDLKDKITFFPIKLSRGGMNPVNDILYFLQLFKIYNSFNPSYIFHYTIKPNIYGSLVSKILRIPSTVMITGLGYVFTNNNIGSKIARLLYKFSMRFPNRILVLNEENYKTIVNNGIANADKVILLKGGEGVNLEKFKD